MVRIITDSAADFEPAELERMHITCIPLKVLFGEEEYQENIDLSKGQFYEKMKAYEGFPKTSQAAPAVLADLFEDAKAAGDEVIYFTLSSALSGTWQSAMFVRRMQTGRGLMWWTAAMLPVDSGCWWSMPFVSAMKANLPRKLWNW